MVKRQFQDTHWLEQMQAYQATLVNQWDLIWKTDVNTTADLPWTGNTIGDTRLVKENGFAYRYTDSWWKKIAWSGGWGGWSTSWWDIEWTLSDQTDLQNALNAKQWTLTEWNWIEIDNWTISNTWVLSVNGDAWAVTVDEFTPDNEWVTGNVLKKTENWYEWWEWGWGGWDFDPEGYYPQLHAGMADNLYTDDNIIDIDVWNFRTTAGSESVPSSGTASLNNLKWRMERTAAKTGWTIDITTTEGISASADKYAFINAVNNITDTYSFELTSGIWDVDPSTYWITATLQQAEFSIDNGSFTDDWTTFKTYVSSSRWNFTLSYDTDNSERVLTNWTDTWSTADTTIFWISTPGSTADIVTITYYEAVTDWTIDVDFVAEVQWTLTVANPVKLVATWVNQYDWTTYIDNAEIDANWEIVSWSNKVVYVYAYGWVTNWYMWYSADGYIVNCGWIATLPQIGDTLDQTWASVTTTACSMPFADTGFFCVEVSDDTGLSVHPKWSWQQDTNTDAYETDTVNIPTEDTNSNALPTDSYGMPALWDVCDEINFQTNKYIQRIGQTSFSYSNLVTVAAMWVSFDYDDTNIFYVLANPVVSDISGTWTYTANDYWTERFLDSNDDIIDIPVEANTSYGSNLVDKLRTWVVTKEEYPKVMDQATYDALPSTKLTDGIIRFIYTEE